MLPLHRHWFRIALLAGALFLALGVARWLPRRASDPLVDTPQLALAQLAAGPLYCNGPARPWLLAQRPDLLPAEDRDANSQRAREFAQAAAVPALFRQLDRRERFATLFFVGDPSQSRALLDHLVQTGDFTLTYLDHTSFIFRRGSGVKAWGPEGLAEFRRQLASASDADRARALALAGAKLTAIQRRPEARALIDEALALDRRSAEAWTAQAGLALAAGQWREAVESTDRALRLEPGHLGAMAARAQVFYATKRYDEALAIAEKLLTRLPDDPNVLFKHAQIAHEAHAYQREIASLQKLITLAEADQRSTTGYRLYLAQAFMAAGEGQPALEEFARVLADPDLPEDQRKFSTDAVERIKKRTGL